ncbi:MAG: patatin-like phospholipase family protein [Rhodobiaceae bacterium]|nr:patatin-like phospholipase family protein [Rhodobiaceae bacterium]
MNMIERQPPNALYERTALVLQGGGALGAYQAGAYESLAKAGIHPDWIAGISIGAINAAIMAGNAPADRVERLRSFWTKITADFPPRVLAGDDAASRYLFGALSSQRAVAGGVQGFFSPRVPAAWLHLPGAAGALSHYDTTPLRKTLLDHVDFDRINAGETRLSLGAVNIRTGNFTYFDTDRQPIGPEHVMASGALPPGFPPVEIDGEYYWDGGLVSNTPLAYVLGEDGFRTMLAIQIDLFSATGPFPKTIEDVEERRKDIVYSSRTRLNTDRFSDEHRLRQAIARLAEALPADKRNDPRLAALTDMGATHEVAVVHLIYRSVGYDGPAKDYEFSRRSMLEHWAAGAADARRTIRAKDWRVPPRSRAGIAVYDMTRAGVA